MEWPWDKWPLAPEDTCSSSCEEHKQRPAPKPPDPGGPAHAQPYPNQSLPYPFYSPTAMDPPPPPDNFPTLKGETPRELRNKAEKQRRDKLTKSINELSKIVPPVLAMNRKVDKTSVLRLTAHYLRSHQYVFGDSINSPNQFGESSIEALMSFLNGFIITTTYKGLVVVVSPNIQKYIGYTELDLIGHNIINIIHEEDQQMMLNQLMPKSFLVGSNDEILFPDDMESKEKVAEALANERRSFNVRFKKNGQRSQPHKYVNCHIQGSFRKSDRASMNNSRHNQILRRLRSRCPNWSTSGNDAVFVGLVQPTYETFETESKLDSCLMEYRTRHSIDGEIISCDSRISIATGYMANEVKGVNAMNFMHRDDVRWVIVALREMYDQHRLSGESCYRLMTKCGKFVYMRTKGYLEVDKDTGAVTSFVCINRVVDKVEGKQLNMEMKKKYNMLVNNSDETPPEDDDDDDDDPEVYGSQGLPVEDPRQLQKVILHLVTNLPSPSPDTTQSNSPFQEERSPYRLSIIPPKKERIFHAIDKIYNVIECFKYSSEYLRYKKLKMSKRPPKKEKSGPDKPKKPKKSHSDSTSRTSNNEQPKPDTSTSQNIEPLIPDTPTSHNIEPFGFYPDLIPGTTTEISPQAGPSSLQRPIDPLLLRRLYDNESDYKTENHAQVSNTMKDSIKTYALMIPAIVSRKFCNSPSEFLEEHRYIQPLSPTPNVDTNRQSTDTSTLLQSHEAPSARNMEESNSSAPRDPGSGSTSDTSALPSSNRDNDYRTTSDVRPNIPPTYYPDYGYPQNCPEEIQPPPSRTPVLPSPIQPPPMQPPPMQPPPMQPPPMQPPPMQPPPMQPQPLQPLSMQPTPVQNYYIPSDVPYLRIPASHVQNYSTSPFPVPNYPIPPSPYPNYGVPSFTPNYPIPHSHIPHIQYPVDPFWQQAFPTYMGRFYQTEPCTEEPVGSSCEQNYTTETISFPSTSQYLDSIDTSKYFQDINIPQPANTTQEELMECLGDLDLANDESLDDAFLDDLIRNHISQHVNIP
ncbi:PREDICTED: hypoxia-inducible factor 1-alpha-like isoform X2 [Papilio polytes]|uniref:hypoxia-inducible factor 1-alpha-like isoform X2 n=1 Tax=Papilio polytes TaxID=76194 RepID=UPI00067635F9|nr:PREDICTED: hypoxia-inducible factor 1-alpha-like isoform X2 [Papilio polytes]